MNAILILILLVLCKAALSDRQTEQEALLRIKRQEEELANCDQCGLSFDRVQRVPVIINGTNVASSSKYPWMVALIQTGTSHIFCGGAILNRNFILTAAHCMVDQQKQMKFNKKNGNSSEMKCPGKKCPIKGLLMTVGQVTVGFLTPGWYKGVKPRTSAANIMVHPEYYYYEGKAHDIALIQLANPINCNMHANPICLPPSSVVLLPDSLVRITGYGQQDPRNPVPAQELSEATIQLTDKEECRNMGFDETDMDKMYCLKGYQGGTPCFGDSGGSMFGKLYGKQYVTLGVASLQSSPTCDSRANVVYTSVSNHLPWIQEMMGGGQIGDYYDSGDYFWGGDYYGSEGGMQGKNDTKGQKTKGSSSTKKGKKSRGSSKKGESKESGR